MGIIGFKIVSDVAEETAVTKTLKSKNIVEATLYGKGYDLYVTVPRKEKDTTNRKTYIDAACYDYANFKRGIYLTPRAVVYTEHIRHFPGFDSDIEVNYFALFAGIDVKGYYEGSSGTFIITHVNYPFEQSSFQALNVDNLLRTIKKGTYSNYNRMNNNAKT